MRTYHCDRCRSQVPVNEHQRLTTPRVLGLGIFAWAFKKREYSCSNCGSPVRAVKSTIKMPGTYRCEKNGHNLSYKRDNCPIDGSRVYRVGK